MGPNFRLVRLDLGPYESELRTAFKEQRLLQVEADHLEEKIRAATRADEEVANSQASHARA